MQASKKGSFAQRMASAASSAIENWDDDADFQGDLRGDIFANSTSTVKSMSSRLSIRSESNAGDDDWQMLLAPNDALSTMHAISSAKQAGIPIPTSVPPSALLGGSIKRLGTKKSNRKIVVDDDWGQDLELPPASNGKLELKPPAPRTPAEDQDEFDDWGEGSLGIRFAGTRREARGGRSSSVSAMSPSLGSCITAESEEDDLAGLVLPSEPLDFTSRLEKLTRIDRSTPDVSPLPNTHQRDLPPTSVPPPQLAPSPLPLPPESEPAPSLGPQRGRETEDDFLDGLEIGAADALDVKKLTLNPKIVVKNSAQKPSVPVAARATATITFSDKPSTSRIPRPLPSTRTRLTPVYESGAPVLGPTRQMPTTTSAQLLRAKRSAPALRNNYPTVPRAPVPFLPAGNSNAQSHHVMTRSSQGHLRRDSDPRRPTSPSMRSYSRMSTTNPPEGTGRAGLRKEGQQTTATSRPLKRPPKTIYGDGTELEIFDDLPISASKEKQFEKHPKNAPAKTLRHPASTSRLPMPDRMATPLPQTPRSPPRVDSTPRFARDTAASRNAREQRLAGTRSRGEGPIPSTPINWKAHVAARSPHSSPTAHRKRGSGKQPMLIKPLSTPVQKNEKGMTYNAILQRWEGNEEALIPFSHPNTSTTTLALTTASTPTFAPPNQSFRSHDRSQSLSHTALSTIHASQKTVSSRAVRVSAAPVPSPPRPALIAQRNRPRSVQYDNGMRFDPVKMKWFKERAPRGPADRVIPPVDGPNDDDDVDPFEGIEDLKVSDSTAAFNAGVGAMSSNPDDSAFVGEEFDVGPSFIRRQRDEENVWRRRTEAWVGAHRDNGQKRYEGWRWELRTLALGDPRR
ncbi:uncharacterized protein EI97DRAFT_468970 [Westerdykella ornata]|uniref:Cytokinesis regulator n=1 Tax=Westerdykella ornata TaxID=318751 RepID=A0A6A6JCC5_WESOR|nr:uncharacterized protein EI97DRAFT_468970 [Westerdykella ornata]KAF2274270.1 hypothetical protein EI97DRAFT_468970 [Westerdykella ornata]